MNKTVSIHLAGTFFHIDEIAYERLSQYLESIKKRFTNEAERLEIMNDIEARIAELFLEKVKNERQVVNLADVEEMITVMGAPEDYTDAENDTQKREKTYEGQIPKRLFRDPDSKILGGVSGGLAHYFGMDVVWVRLIWVLLVLAGFGSGIILYVVLWAIVPEAHSTSEKLAMKGFSANISNIEKKFKKKIEQATDKINQTDFSDTGKQVKEGVRSGLSGLGEIVQTLVQIVVKFVGFILVLIALGVLVSMTVSFFVGLFMNFTDGPWGLVFDQVTESSWPIWSIFLAVFLVVGIPFFYLFQSGLSLISGAMRSVGNIANLVLLAFWLAAVSFLIAFAIIEGEPRASHAYNELSKSESFAVQDTLLIKVSSDHQYSDFAQHRFGLIVDKDRHVSHLEHDVTLRLLKSDDSLVEVKIIKKGYEAENLDSKIHFDYQIEGNRLVFNDYFLTEIKKVNQSESVEVLLYVPENIPFKLDPSARAIYRQRDGDLPYVSFDWYGEALEIQDGLLNCLTCEEAA
ncbi:MAG: PspC domain-containing protein [Bacteroidetes bacterium]|nr:PspC domain-containing protein [Bacteroidota bacterium]